MRLVLAGVLAISAMPTTVSVTQAASFDCGKASSQVEKAICANPELGRRDEVLAKAYATALGGLSDEAKAIVQSGQRAWLDFAGLACTADAKPFTAPLKTEEQNCLLSEYTQRIGVLAQSRMQGDYRFYPVNAYHVVDDPDVESFRGVATREVSYPQIDEDSAVAEAFNALMAADHDAEPDPTAEDYRTADTIVTTEVVGVNTHRISVSTNAWWYGHGAAHGNYAITYTHYLIEEDRVLEAGDVFAGDAWQAQLGELALAELQHAVPGGIWDDAAEAVDKAVVDPSRWNFTDMGLEIIFQPYEVAAYAVGAPTITVGWDKLDGLLAESYSALLY